MIQINSTGKGSRIFALLIAVFPLLFFWIILGLSGSSLAHYLNTVGFYIVLVIYLIFISIHLYYNFFDYDVFIKDDIIILKRYLFPSKMLPMRSVSIESNGLISVFFFGFLLKAENRVYLFKKTPNNLKERLNPDLVVERIKTELNNEHKK